jgi:hypothetical protein
MLEIECCGAGAAAPMDTMRGSEATPSLARVAQDTLRRKVRPHIFESGFARDGDAKENDKKLRTQKNSASTLERARTSTWRISPSIPAAHTDLRRAARGHT